MEDLAKHLLITLAAQIGGSTDGEAESDVDESTWKWSLSNWSRAEVKEMKQSIITLMEAAGEPIHDTSNKTIPDVLESFRMDSAKQSSCKTFCIRTNYWNELSINN